MTQESIKVRVAVGRDIGRMRAGRNWPQGVTEAEVTPAQLKQLQNDNLLSVTVLEAGQDTFDGLTLAELEDRAEKAVEALDEALKSEFPGTDAGADLELRVPHPEAQAQAREHKTQGQARHKALKADAGNITGKTKPEAPKAPEGGSQGQGGPSEALMAKRVPEGMPYAALFTAAGKTLGDVLLMKDASTLVTVQDIGAQRAAEVAMWLDDPANADALKA